MVMRVQFDIPETVLQDLVGKVPIPPMACIRHDMVTPPAIEDIETAVREQLNTSGVGARIKPGQRIAIGVGSRGINRLHEIVATLVEYLKGLGADPFIVPSMGSHGGATAEGQRAVLQHLGVTPELVGAPIESQMETVVVGHTADGTPVRIDRLAAAADGITFVGRVKPHTAFHSRYESGLAKMIAIGLGKQSGAALTHARGFGEMGRMVPAMAEVALANTPLLFGLAVLENAHDEAFKIQVVPADRIMEDEPALLEEARAAMPHLPFDQIDVLVIDEIGKNISGDGADPNITGRYPTPHASGGPSVTQQVVLDLTDASQGNANGVGTADFTTLRLARKMSFADTYPNALTSTVPGPVKLPMVLPNDRMAFQAAILTCHAVDRPPRVVRIRNTLQLQTMWISDALMEEAERSPNISISGAPEPVAFDEAGNLPELPPVPE